MIDRGILPNEVTYRSMMDSLCKQGQSKEAQKLLDLMVRGGIKPDVVSYRILLIGYANYGTIDDVMKILDRMQLNHVAPDLSTYTSLLKAYAKNRKVDQAMCVLNRMKQGVKPDIAASAPILELLLKMGRDEDAKAVMDQTSGKTND
jgi:pentatricopeptide repeat protein